MTIEVKAPSIGKTITVLIGNTAGYAFVGQDHDRDEHRFVLAFYKESPGAKDEPRELTFNIEVVDYGEAHTLSAAVIVNDKVLVTDRDRKRVKTGQSRR